MITAQAVLPTGTYSPFIGRYIAPKAEPACFKEPYYLIPVIFDGAGQDFQIPTLTDYPMSCDVLSDKNGVYLVPTLDFDFTVPTTSINYDAYLNAGDLLEILASPNPASSLRTREYYFFVDTAGANQVFANFPIFADYEVAVNFNVTLNGVLLTPVFDFTFGNNVMTIYPYLNVDDIIGFVPAAKLTSATSVPAFTIAVSSSGAGQSFTNSLFAKYTKSSDAIVTINGINLEPDVSPATNDFGISGSTLTVHPYIATGSSITVLCNTPSCS